MIQKLNSKELKMDPEETYDFFEDHENDEEDDDDGDCLFD